MWNCCNWGIDSLDVTIELIQFLPKVAQSMQHWAAWLMWFIPEFFWSYIPILECRICCTKGYKTHVKIFNVWSFTTTEHKTDMNCQPGRGATVYFQAVSMPTRYIWSAKWSISTENANLEFLYMVLSCWLTLLLDHGFLKMVNLLWPEWVGSPMQSGFGAGNGIPQWHPPRSCPLLL